jgi:hypothetical protein
MPIPPSVEDVKDIFRDASIKLFEGESTFGESAFLKSLDAFRILLVDSPLYPQWPHVLPVV